METIDVFEKTFKSVCVDKDKYYMCSDKEFENYIIALKEEGVIIGLRDEDILRESWKLSTSFISKKEYNVSYHEFYLEMCKIYDRDANIEEMKEGDSNISCKFK